jgi:hypothetical protein
MEFVLTSPHYQHATQEFAAHRGKTSALYFGVCFLRLSVAVQILSKSRIADNIIGRLATQTVT